MPERDDRWWRDGEGEPEPDWPEQIRAGRRARTDELRDVFAGFEDEDPEAPLPAKPKPDGPHEPYDQDRESPT